ncbi:MAG: class I SAM-dependent methyltransferase [Simkaniaceae bacterium]
MFTSHLIFAHSIWKKHVKPESYAIDATCGNGHDSLFLLQCGISYLYCLDIQKRALENTAKRLANFKNYSLHLGCHALFSMVKHPIDLIVYNLGYLPGGDKRLTTQTSTSLKSVENGLKLLNENGLMSITLYPGHLEGAREAKALLHYAFTLPKNQFISCHHRWLNRSHAPTVLFIQKIAYSLF